MQNTFISKFKVGLLLYIGFSSFLGATERFEQLTVIPLHSKQTIVQSTSSPVVSSNSEAQAIAKQLETIRTTFRERADYRKVATAQQPLTLEQKSAFSALQQRIGESLEVRWRDNGTPLQIKGNILEPAIMQGADVRNKEERGESTARRFLRSNRTLLRLENPDAELALTQYQTDDLQRSHLRFTQKYKGLMVWPAELTVHLDPQGNVDLLNGAFVPTPRKPISIQPRVTLEEAIAKALAELAAANDVQPEQSELIVYAPGDKTPRLAWKLSINLTANQKWLMVIDALNAEVLTKYNQVKGNRVLGSGQDLFNNTLPLQLWEAAGQFFVVDTSKPMFNASSLPPFTRPHPDAEGGIFILDLQHELPESGNISLITSNNSRSGFLPDAVNAAFNVSQVYDYYLERHQRNSIDGQGSSIFSVVRTGCGSAELPCGDSGKLNNAFWTGSAMFFGDELRYAAALDVVAHELAHGVTDYTAKLIYQNQPGALNEAFSDIFGEMVEARTLGQTDWASGSLFPAAMQRSLRDPHRSDNPAKMSEYLKTFEDNGGVHTNSNIVNHAYYLLAAGLEGSIGVRDAERIFYRALTTHLVSNSQFIDARLAAINAADELFGNNSRQSQKVAAAFDTVEIFNAPATPAPPSFPAISGTDATTFVCINDEGNFFLCRHDPSLGDGELGVYLSRYDITPTRISVQGDGKMAAFVDSLNDMCLIPTDSREPVEELCLDRPGTVHAVAMSPDGNRYGFVMQDKNTGEPENLITYIDLVNKEQSRVFKLVAPAVEGVATNTILFADAMDFTSDGQFLIYDALNAMQLVDGTRIDSWSIYALDLTSGQTLILVPPVAGLDIGNPILSQTNDNFLAFTVSEPASDESKIFTADLNGGDLVEVGDARGEFAVASYVGDDSAIVYDSADATTLTGYSLVYQAVTQRLTPTGDKRLWLEDAAYGAVYRRGEFNPTPTSRSGGSQITSNLWIKTDIHTEEKGTIEALWKKGGEAQTSRGDKVIWGYFYANPTDVNWGSPNNPEVFVKVWFDVSGRIDVNFFHVSVPNISVHSAKDAGGIESGTTTMATRYIRHYFNVDGTQGNDIHATPDSNARYLKKPNDFTTLLVTALIDTVEKGNIPAELYLGNETQSARGDAVNWGYFYANPAQVNWGSPNNPEAFIKIWRDVSGRIDVNFFHVSVPTVQVSSQTAGTKELDNVENSNIDMEVRYVRHEYAPL